MNVSREEGATNTEKADFDTVIKLLTELRDKQAAPSFDEEKLRGLIKRMLIEERSIFEEERMRRLVIEQLDRTVVDRLHERVDSILESKVEDALSGIDWTSRTNVKRIMENLDMDELAEDVIANLDSDKLAEKFDVDDIVQKVKREIAEALS